MQEWAVPATDVLWRTALTAIPLTLLVMVVCRLLPFRPVTRHALWLTLVLWFAVSPLLPDAPVESLVPARSEPVMADTPPGEPQPRDRRRLESSPPATARPSIDARTEPRLPAWLASAAGSDGLLLEQPHQETGPTQNTTIPPSPHPALTAARGQDAPTQPADAARPKTAVSVLFEPSWPPPVDPIALRRRKTEIVKHCCLRDITPSCNKITQRFIND